MTCRDLFHKKHPEMGDPEEYGACPDIEGIAESPENCRALRGDNPTSIQCKECWDREVTVYKKETLTENDVIEPSEEKEFVLHRNPMADTCVDGLYPHEKVKPHILDSGNRTQFESGAVRDCQAGKGRCDLLPLDIVGECMQSGLILQEISAFCKTGDVDHLYKALWEFSGYWSETDTGSTMMLEVSKHFEEGAVKYGEDNWRKGIPAKRYIDSAVRHYLKFLRGDKDERHDRAFCWNLLCCAWTCTHKPELNDYIKTSEVIRG